MNLFLCKTPIQVLRAIQLTYYSIDDFKDSEICLFNTFDSAESLSANLKKTGVFKEVYFFENDDFKRGKLNYLRLFFNNKLNLVKSDISSITMFNIDSYDSFYFYNKFKKNVKVYYVEDAPMLYSYSAPSLKNRLLYGMFGLQFPIFKVAKWYFSAPEKMEITNLSPKLKLDQIDRNDVGFKNLVNLIFDYQKDEQINKTQVFIMEESFYTDNRIKQSKDFHFYKWIQNQFPDITFTVKLHPRTKRNRFSDDFMVLSNSSIPWEVFLLNEPMEDKVFLSLSCSTVISPKLLFGDENRSLMLYELFLDDVSAFNGGPYYTENWKRNLLEITRLYSNQNNIAIPNTSGEVMTILKNWIKDSGGNHE